MDEKRAAEVKASEKQIKAMLGRMLPAKLERFTGTVQVGQFKKKMSILKHLENEFADFFEIQNPDMQERRQRYSRLAGVEVGFNLELPQ